MKVSKIAKKNEVIKAIMAYHRFEGGRRVDKWLVPLFPNITTEGEFQKLPSINFNRGVIAPVDTDLVDYDYDDGTGIYYPP